MPLIIITGYPCSGKSYRAAQLHADFQARTQTSLANTSSTKIITTYIPSYHSSLDPLTPELKFQTSLDKDATNNASEQDSRSNPRDQIYSSASLEKTARAEEFSSIKRALSKNSIVIADGLNYIKGFRYQLWCEAKAAGTRCVVVHVGAREDQVRQWNYARLQSWGWHDTKQSQEHENVKRHGGMVGKDVLGDLMPEAHTAIYGDRVAGLDEGRQSRGSSLDGAVSDEDLHETADEAQRLQKKAKDTDTMTLTSLYISDHHKTTGVDSPLRNDNQSIKPDTTGKNDNLDAPLGLPVPPPAPSSSLPYSSATLDALIMRYEPPSPFTRWDTPLFVIPSSDAHPPCAAIWSAIFPSPTKPLSKKAKSQLAPSSRDQQLQEDGVAHKEAPQEVRRHAATVLPRATESEALQVLENATGDVVKSLLAAARSAGLADGEGGSLTFTVGSGVQNRQEQEPIHKQSQQQGGGGDVELMLPVGLVLSQPVLQRLRRKYTQIQRGGIAHGVGYVSGRQDVIEGFVGFLQAEWEQS